MRLVVNIDNTRNTYHTSYRKLQHSSRSKHGHCRSSDCAVAEKYAPLSNIAFAHFADGYSRTPETRRRYHIESEMRRNNQMSYNNIPKPVRRTNFRYFLNHDSQ